MPSKLTITTEDVRAELERRKRNKINYMFPDTGPFSRDQYPKHMEVIAETKDKRQVCMLAANRVGKSELGAYITSCHATGIYPKWWNGKKFTKPTSIIVCGETGQLVRDSVQEKLLGPITAFGTGLIPGDLITDKRPRSGIPNAVDTVLVQHISGGVSTIQFQSYDQGREKFQATARHLVWCDEEPPLEIYTEILLRTMTTGGLVLSTFTPLKGMSTTVLHIKQQAEEGLAAVITATWDDAPHLSEEDKTELWASLPPHQRDARSKGVPSLGSGAIYPVPESDFVITPMMIPIHWRWCYGMDVGWNNTAAVWLAYDPESDTIYITNEYKRGQAEPAVHASAVRQMKGDWVPGAIDPASRGRAQSDGEQLLNSYQQQGLNLVLADNGVESGLFNVYERLSTGRIKVFSTCVKWLEEFRLYRRDEKGRIVKEMDHLMDATRYAVNACTKIALQSENDRRTNMSKLAPSGGISPWAR